MDIDIRVTELLASKICHDLVSPVSAINNGVELIQDIGGSVVDEAMKLIGDSGLKASRRLRLYRLAYGRAGNEGALTVRDVRAVVEQYLLDTKISLVWPQDVPDSSIEGTRGFLRTVLNLVVLGEESLAYGGVITLRSVEAAEGIKGGCRIEVVGRNAMLGPLIQEALSGETSVENLSPRSIQAYFTGRLAEQFYFKLSYDQSIPDRLDLFLSIQNDESCMQDVKVS